MNNYILPVDKLSDRMPDRIEEIRSDVLPRQRIVDEGIAASIIAGMPSFVYEGMAAQNPATSQMLRNMISPDPMEKIIQDSYEKDLTPEEASNVIQNEMAKQSDWASVGNNFYLEQALASNDPSIRNEAVRFAVNMQVGQELFEQALEENSDDKSWFGYGVDFIDRYFIRSFPIGAIENLTRRSERKGQELLTAAATMDPREYRVFISNYVDELKREGVFKGDNIFALSEGAEEQSNAGFDNWAGANQLLSPLDLLPAAAIYKGAKSVALSTTALRRTAALAGPEAAGKAAKKIITANPDAPPPRVIQDILPDVLEPGAPAPVKVPTNRAVELLEENKIVQEINYLNSRSILGRGFDSPEVQKAAETVIETLRKFTSNPIVNIDDSIRRGATGDYTMELHLGTRGKGNPYRTEKAAQKAAAKLRESDFPTAEVIPVDVNDASKGFYVRVTERLNTNNEAIEALPTEARMGFLKTFIARYTASRAATENPLLNTLAGLAQDGATRIGQAVKPELKILSRLNNKSRDTLSRIFTDLRDGPDSFIREAYNEAEFVRKWRAITGEAPTQLDIDAYHAIRSINDTSWLLRAHNRMKAYVEKGYYAVVFPDGTRYAARLKQPPTETTGILDISTNRITSLREARREMKVWELDTELEGGIRYITKPSKVSVLAPDDILGYNAGGRRINPNANYFVTAGDQNPRAFLTTFTEKQAKKAVEQITAIQEMIGGRTGLVGKAKKAVDDFILENNDWNENIQSLDDFVEFMGKHNIPLDLPINFKTRDGVIRTGETLDEFSSTWGEHFTFTRKRSDDLLTEYGGREPVQRDPVSAIFEDFTSVTHQYARNIYTETALNAWVKAARRKGSGWSVPPTSNVRKAFTEATMTETKSRPAAELARQRSIIESRMNVPSELSRAMEEFGQAAREFVFEKTKGKVALSGKGLDPATEGLLKIGFQSAFGFFNASQFLVQSFHAVTILAMAPKHAMQGIGLAPVIQVLLHSSDANVSRLARARLAKFSGLAESDIDDLVEYISVSGRNIVESTAIEAGTSSHWGISGWKGQSLLPSRLRDARDMAKASGSAVLDAGLMFFKEGERMARLTSAITAFLEFKSKFPKMATSTAFARQWISRRDHALSFRMTNVDRAAMQEGIGRIPFQWFTYSMRVMENIFIGRDLTVGERARMAAITIPFFGLTGMGLEKATDYIAERVGAEPGGALASTIQYGIIDGLIETVTGEETALATRLAPMTLFFDIWRNVDGEATPLEMLAGPSGQITARLVGSLFTAASNIWAGHPVSLTEDTIRVMRQFSGIDNVHKAYGIYQNGVYRSRTGRSLPFEMDTGDAIQQLLGFTPAEVNEWYSRQRWSYQDAKKVREFSNRMREEWNEAIRIWENGNPRRALELMKELEDKIALSGFSPYDQSNIRRSLRDLIVDDVNRLVTDEYRRGRPFTAETIEETFKPFGTRDVSSE